MLEPELMGTRREAGGQEWGFSLPISSLPSPGQEAELIWIAQVDITASLPALGSLEKAASQHLFTS